MHWWVWNLAKVMRRTGEKHTHTKKEHISVYYRHFKASKKTAFSGERAILPMKIAAQSYALICPVPGTIQTFHIRNAWWCPWPTKHRGVPGVYAPNPQVFRSFSESFTLGSSDNPWDTSEIFRNPLGHHASSACALLIDRHNLGYNPL